MAGRLRASPPYHAVLDLGAAARLLVWQATRSAPAPLASSAALRDAFREAQRGAECAHSLEESLIVLDLVLGHAAVPGDFVECGVYKGGMTAKLSLLANTLDRRLYAYDSFQGLPDPTRYGTGDQVATYVQKFRRGMRYRGGLPEVRATVFRYGALARCEFRPGWFEQSFARPTGHPAAIAFAFIDVDLTRSVRECLGFVWPRLAPGGILFCHEARDPGVIDELTRSGLTAHDAHGVGTGLGGDAPNLCWIRKRRDATGSGRADGERSR
jgi:O-methyltransferase